MLSPCCDRLPLCSQVNCPPTVILWSFSTDQVNTSPCEDLGDWTAPSFRRRADRRQAHLIIPCWAEKFQSRGKDMCPGSGSLVWHLDNSTILSKTWLRGNVPEKVRETGRHRAQAYPALWHPDSREIWSPRQQPNLWEATWDPQVCKSPIWG